MRRDRQLLEGFDELVIPTFPPGMVRITTGHTGQ
jgi:hypothetical protein